MASEDTAGTFGPDTSEQDLLMGVAAELGALEREGVAVLIDLSAVRAFQLLALLQCALRHPEHSAGSLTPTGRDIVERIRHTIERGPAIAECIRRGSPCAS